MVAATQRRAAASAAAADRRRARYVGRRSSAGSDVGRRSIAREFATAARCAAVWRGLRRGLLVRHSANHRSAPLRDAVVRSVAATRVVAGAAGRRLPEFCR